MIINLTQHPATPEQKAQGVIDLPPDLLSEVKAALTVEKLPLGNEIRDRAVFIAGLIASNQSGSDRADEEGNLPEGDTGVFWEEAMIGGAPWLMSALEDALRDQGIEPVYAFSRRESIEEPQPDGSVKKTQVFKHIGFVRGAGLR